MAPAVSIDGQSDPPTNEEQLHPDERQMLFVFRKNPLIASPSELQKKLPQMSHLAAHVAVCNLVVSGYVEFSPEGYRLIDG